MLIKKQKIMNTKNIILLDLNATFAYPTHQNGVAWYHYTNEKVQQEEYKLALLEQIKDCYVIMITARLDSMKEQSLMRIAEYCNGWQPHEAYFKPVRLKYRKAADWKNYVLKNYVFPIHGTANETYLALESNSHTRQMYAKNNIKAVRVNDPIIDIYSLIPDQYIPKNKSHEQSSLWE